MHPRSPRRPYRQLLPIFVTSILLTVSTPARALDGGFDLERRAWVENTLASMTLRDRVAQMVMPYIAGGEPKARSVEARRVRALVTEQRVGGVIVGKGAAAGTVAWLNTLQRLSDVPLLVAADLEWGPGTRLVGGTLFPVNMAIAAAGGPALAREAGRLTAVEARAAGIHMAFAPVADVNVNPSNPVINTRSYGADPAKVAACVAAFIEGAERAGLLTVAKHFPGHGDTETDSHLGLPVLQLSRDRLAQVELLPFRAAVAADVAGVMTAHIAVPALEPDGARRPGTFSPAILQDLLRGELGFDGLVVTDALIMDGARDYAPKGASAVLAVLSGADILLMPPDAGEAIAAVVAAVDSGQIAEARIDASVRKILAAKAGLDLHTMRTVDEAVARRTIGAAAHRAWAGDVAARSITLVRRNHTAFPLRLASASGPVPRVVSIVYDDPKRRTLGSALAAALESEGARVETVQLWRRSTARELVDAEAAAKGADVVVFSTYASTAPWKGVTGLPAEVAAVANRLGAAGATVISFGDPYVLRQIPAASTFLLAWSDHEATIRAAARALAGEGAVLGRLPIELPGYYQLGQGLVMPAYAPLWRALAPAAIEPTPDALERPER